MKSIFKIQLLTLLLLLTISPAISQNTSVNELGIDVKNYEINLDVTNISDEIIHGHTKITFIPTTINQKRFKLQLIGFEVQKVLLNDKETKNYTNTKNEIVVIFDKQVSIKDILTLDIYYKGRPAEDPSWGGFFFKKNTAFNIGVGMKSVPHGFGRAWFPCVDSFEDRATYSFNITVNEGFTAVCSGVKVGEYEKADKTVLFKWELKDEVPTYLVSIAVGEYEEIGYDYKGLERTFPVQMFVKQDLASKLLGSFRNLPKAIKTYETKYYPYAWERVGFVGVPFKSGAMEHVCNIAYPEYAIDGTLDKETLMAHELSHHWFGNLVTCKTAGDMWLNEGWASFSEALFIESVYGNKKYKEYSRKRHRFVLENAHRYDGGYYSVANVPDHLTYGSTVYKKGADVVHSLRGYLGDSIFFDLIHKYFDANKFTTVSTNEFEKFLTDNSGINMKPFFNSWLHTPGFSHFEITHGMTTRNLTQGDVNYRTRVIVKQRLKERTDLSLNNKVEITFLDKAFNLHTFTSEISSRIDTLTFDLQFNPKSVFIDLNEKVMDATVDCYHIVDKKSEYTFEETDFALDVINIGNKFFIQSTLNFIRPLEGNYCNYLLTKYKYWKIDGFIGGDQLSSAQFSFNSKKIDLITKNSDLKLLYRDSDRGAWIETDAKLVPVNGETAAYFQLDKLKLGYYTIGI